MELVPQRVGPSRDDERGRIKNSTRTKERKKEGEVPTNKEEKKKRRSKQIETAQAREGGAEESLIKRRYEEIAYFPENMSNTADKSKGERGSWASAFLPKGAPDYLFYVFSSELKTGPSQLLAVIPLTDVRITPISPMEFTISYINRLPNTHCIRLKSPEMMTAWLSTLELATQLSIHNPFQFTRSRGSSISHGIAALRETLSAPRIRRTSAANSSRVDPVSGAGAMRESNSGQRAAGQRAAAQREDAEQFYKYVCWDADELLAEGGPAFSGRMQLQEVYLNDSGSDLHPLADLVRQGWRMLGGTLSDIVCWCLLSSERGDKRM